MKKMLKFAGALAVAFALTQTIQAVPVTGAIGFHGSVTYDTSSAGDAHQVTSWITPLTGTSSGSFAGIAGNTAATFAAGIWNFAYGGPGINNFWSVGGFSFQLLSSFVFAQGGTPGQNGFVVVNGTGIVTGNGYTPTSMFWSFTSQDPATGSNPDTWTFSASSNANGVPDGGATVMLLGIALSGAALLRKKLTA